MVSDVGTLPATVAGVRPAGVADDGGDLMVGNADFGDWIVTLTPDGVAGFDTDVGVVGLAGDELTTTVFFVVDVTWLMVDDNSRI